MCRSGSAEFYKEKELEMKFKIYCIFSLLALFGLINFYQRHRRRLQLQRSEPSVLLFQYTTYYVYMDCIVFRFDELERCFLFISPNVELKSLLPTIKGIPGKPIMSKTMEIKKSSNLMGIKGKAILANICSQGYYIAYPVQFDGA